VGAGKYALLGLLPLKEQAAMFGVLDACNAMWQREFDAAKLAELEEQVASALAAAEVALPASELDIKLHNLMHLAQQVRKLGPLWTQACWFFERLYGWLVRYIGNTAYPTASMATGHTNTTAAAFGRLGPIAAAVEAHSGTRLAAASDVAGMDRRQIDADGSFLLPTSWLAVDTDAGDIPVQLHGEGRRIKPSAPQLRALHVHYVSLTAGGADYQQAFLAFVEPLLPAAPQAHQPERDRSSGAITNWPPAALDHWLAAWPGAPRAAATKHTAITIGAVTFKHPRRTDGTSNPTDARLLGRSYQDEPETCWFGEVQEVWSHAPPESFARPDAEPILLVNWFKKSIIPGRGLDKQLKVPCMPKGWELPREQFLGCNMVAPTPIIVVDHPTDSRKWVVLHRDGKFYEKY